MAGTPTWNSVGANFSGSNQAMANALRGISSIGDLGTTLVNQERQAEALKLQQAAEDRASQQFGMEKQKYQDQLNARTAANQYYNQLTSALAPGTVGVADQNTLGTQLAGLGQQAQAAYDKGDKALGDQLVAQQQSVLSGQLPGMQQAYQKSPQAKVDLLNTLTAPTSMDVRDRLGILKDVTAPMDKAIDREQTIEGQKALEKMRSENDQKIWEKRFEIEQAKLDAREKRQEALLKSKEDLLDKKYNLVEKEKERKETQKIADSANAEIEAMKAKIKTMDPQAEETKALQIALDKSMAYLHDDKIPIQAKEKAVKDLAETFKTTEERGYKEAQKEKELDTKRMTAINETFGGKFGWRGADMKDLRDALTEGLKSSKDRQALQDKYSDSDEDAVTLIKDLYKDKKLKSELDAILLGNKSADDWWSSSKEDDLVKLLRRPDVRKSLLGRELTSTEKKTPYEKVPYIYGGTN